MQILLCFLDDMIKKTSVQRDEEIADRQCSITVKDQKFICQVSVNTCKQRYPIHFYSVFGFFFRGNKVTPATEWVVYGNGYVVNANDRGRDSARSIVRMCYNGWKFF